MPTVPEFRVQAASLDLMEVIGRSLANALGPGDTVLLVGDLGAGKTTLTKIIAANLGVTEEVTSPTFTIARSYECGPDARIRQLMHVDAYRLGGAQDLEAVGLFEALGDGAAALIEWGDIVADAIESPLIISLAFVDAEHRSIAFRIDPVDPVDPVDPAGRWVQRLELIVGEIRAALC